MPRKRDKTNQGIQKRDVNAALRVDQAIRLRAGHMPWKDVAAQCGYSNPGAAYHAVQRELNRRISTDIDEMRREEGVILMELHRVLWPLAVGNPAIVIHDDDDTETRKEKRTARKPSLFAVDRVLAIRESYRKLYGIDADGAAAMAGMAQQRKVILFGSQQQQQAQALPAPASDATDDGEYADASSSSSQ